MKGSYEFINKDIFFIQRSITPASIQILYKWFCAPFNTNFIYSNFSLSAYIIRINGSSCATPKTAYMVQQRWKWLVMCGLHFSIYIYEYNLFRQPHVIGWNRTCLPRRVTVRSRVESYILEMEMPQMQRYNLERRKNPRHSSISDFHSYVRRVSHRHFALAWLCRGAPTELHCDA